MTVAFSQIEHLFDEAAKLILTYGFHKAARLCYVLFRPNCRTLTTADSASVESAGRLFTISQTRRTIPYRRTA